MGELVQQPAARIVRRAPGLAPSPKRLSAIA
jgi:hypothetical protein